MLKKGGLKEVKVEVYVCVRLCYYNLAEIRELGLIT